MYVDDGSPAGVLHGVTVRSPAARGRITAVRFDPAIPWDEFVVVTAADIPSNVVKLLTEDQPYLARDVVNHREEPIALIAHRDRARAEEARRLVTVEIDPLPAVFTIDDTLARREIVWGVDNVFKSYAVQMDIDFTIDGGAYCTLSPVVLSRGTIHAAGPYSCPNVRVRGPLVNRHVWAGLLVMAFRAADRGAPWAADEQRRFAVALAEDIERGRPAAVFIDDAAACDGCQAR
jgi:CO/xanthine dehydrogenase Mo-binding subunit